MPPSQRELARLLSHWLEATTPPAPTSFLDELPVGRFTRFDHFPLPTRDDVAPQLLESAAALGIRVGDALNTPEGDTALVVYQMLGHHNPLAGVVIDALKDASNLEHAGQHRKAVQRLQLTGVGLLLLGAIWLASRD